jgi:hypothetical protein
MQVWAARSPAVGRVATTLGLLPVPATALLLFVIIAAVVLQLGAAVDAAPCGSGLSSVLQAAALVEELAGV